MTDLTVKMLGRPSKPKLKAKAAESWGVLLFSRDMVQKYSAKVGAESACLVEAANCLEAIIDNFRASGINMHPRRLQEIPNKTVRNGCARNGWLGCAGG